MASPDTMSFFGPILKKKYPELSQFKINYIGLKYRLDLIRTNQHILHKLPLTLQNYYARKKCDPLILAVAANNYQYLQATVTRDEKSTWQTLAVLLKSNDLLYEYISKT